MVDSHVWTCAFVCAKHEVLLLGLFGRAITPDCLIKARLKAGLQQTLTTLGLILCTETALLALFEFSSAFTSIALLLQC